MWLCKKKKKERDGFERFLWQQKQNRSWKRAEVQRVKVEVLARQRMVGKGAQQEHRPAMEGDSRSLFVPHAWLGAYQRSVASDCHPEKPLVLTAHTSEGLSCSNALR